VRYASKQKLLAPPNKNIKEQKGIFFG